MTGSGDTAARLLALLPNDGTPRTNAELRKLLEVPDDEYWSVRNDLVTDGVVTKLPGRGGRTALVVSESSRGEHEGSGLAWLIRGAFGSSLFTVAVAVAYGVIFTGSDNLVWNLLSLVFGGVALAAVGVSLLIYKVQTDSAQLEAEGQARVLRRLEGLARQAATSSSDTRELVRAMKPAVNATSTAESAPISTNSVGEGDESRGGQEQRDGEVLRDEYGAYYLPPAIPLKVVSDLVKWWDSEGATGRWTLSRLIGGYRQYNASGNFVGVPWVLTFDGGKEGHRSFRLAYSGRQKGPAISELEGGVWLDLEDGNER